jgi:hydroxymethylpyrimidine/phosphomethylpyrimidine kinase
VIATSGYRLTPTDAVSLLVKELIPRSTLVTPNIPEAEIITGYSNLSKRDDIREAANIILGMGARAVVIKGGHGRGSESVDMVVTRDKEAYLSALRAPYEVHGSGCCFSAAVTAFLASGYGIYDACNQAKEVVTIGIKRAIKSPLGRYIVNPCRISDKSDPLWALPGTGR